MAISQLKHHYGKFSISSNLPMPTYEKAAKAVDAILKSKNKGGDWIEFGLLFYILALNEIVLNIV